MKILFVCNKMPYPPKDGGQIATFSMIRGMAEAGHTVTVAVINTPKHYYDLNAMPADVRALADFHAVDVDTDLHAKDALVNLLFSREPYTATRFNNPDFAYLLRKLCREKTFDIVQLEGLYLCAYISIFRTYTSATIAYRAHNVEYEIWQRLASETRFLPKAWYLKNLAKRVERYEREAVNQYDCLVPISERDAATYARLGNTKPVFTAPAGIFVNDRPKPEQTVTDKPTLFHIGALDWAPNTQGILWFLEHCWPTLRKLYPWLEFHVAGRHAAQSFIDAIDLEGVVYDGEVPDAYTYMSSHTIMLVPLLAGGGMRIKILEGLAAGKAIVSTSIGAEGIPAQPSVEMSIADSPQDFIAGIQNLIDEPQRISEMGDKAIAFVTREFDNAAIIRRLTTFYSSL